MSQPRRYLHLTINRQITLKRGDRGPPVRELQGDLQRLGYYRGQVDGLYGPKTAAAVRAFQADVKLARSIEAATGRLGNQTASALMHAMRERFGTQLIPQQRGRLEEITVQADRPTGRLRALLTDPRFVIGGSVATLFLGAMVYHIRIRG